MLYVGLDIHSKHITVCVLDENGRRVQRRQVRTIDEMMQLLEELPDRFAVCYEAGCGYGHYHDLLRPLADRVLVAHPGQLQLIFRSKNKNDRKDAERLAKLLYLGEVPTVHVPSQDVRAWRELITCRRRLIEKRTKAKNGLRALLRSVGLRAPRHPGFVIRASGSVGDSHSSFDTFLSLRPLSKRRASSSVGFSMPASSASRFR
jgi:transposase